MNRVFLRGFSEQGVPYEQGVQDKGSKRERPAGPVKFKVSQLQESQYTQGLEEERFEMFQLISLTVLGSDSGWQTSGPRDYDADRFVGASLGRPGSRRYYFTSGADDVLPPPGCIEGLGRKAQRG
jgi:hypothetical protein